jgi:hypothetical protein
MKVGLGLNLIDEYNEVVLDITNYQCTTRFRAVKRAAAKMASR